MPTRSTGTSAGRHGRSGSQTGRAGALALAVAVAGCVGGAGEGAPSPERRAIVGGTLHTGHPGVGALVIDYAGYFDHFCSGTLIASQWVLTAAHCLDEPDVEPYMVSFYVGADARSEPGGTAYDVDGFFPHSGYSPSDGSDDIGLVHLRSPATGVAPYPYGGTPRVGTSLTWVGYGVTSDGGTDGGLKRIGYGTISEVYWANYGYGFDRQMPCSGDSGGAAFATVGGVENLVGVIASGDERCSSFGIDTRVDYYLTWISATMAGTTLRECRITGGDCGRQACFPVDGDELACVPSAGIRLGAACDADGSTWGETLPCADGLLCVAVSSTDPHAGECMSFCRSAADCTGGYTCEVPIFTDLADIGICIEPMTPCRITGGDCPAGEACFPASDNETYCFPSDGLGEDAACDADQSSWDTLPCGDGMICLRVSAGVHDGRCFDFCLSDADCPGESCRRPLFSGIAEIGYCLDAASCTDEDGDGHCAGVDCDDSNASVHPGAVEVCGDGVDQDCDGLVDETCGCTDADGDGLCAEDDCDDADPTVGARAAEDCDNGLDDDCDGFVDGEDADCGGEGGDAGPDGGGGGGVDEIPGACDRCSLTGAPPGSAPALLALVVLGLALLRRR